MTTIPYEDLIDVADVAKDWYVGQGDPVYALVSLVYAGRDVPLGIADDALRHLHSDYRKLKDKDSVDAERLLEAMSFLDWQIQETRRAAARKPNPLAVANPMGMGTPEVVMIGVGLVAGLAALLYYTAKAVGTGVGTAVGQGATTTV
jgi:hypothetical protein